MRKTLVRRRIPLKYLLALGLGLAVAATASADTYLGRAISLVVPCPAGGASDIIARLVAERLQQALKQPVVVENRAGANGIIAYSHVAKSPTDGSTLLMGNIGPSAINPSIYKKLPYDAEKEFAPITLVSWVPLMLVANPALGASTVQDVIAKAKARPVGLSYGVSGIGTAGHLAMELFKSNAGVNIQPINYKGDSPALVDTVAGHVDIIVATVIVTSACTDYMLSAVGNRRVVSLRAEAPGIRVALRNLDLSQLKSQMASGDVNLPS